jgi:small subunit ribosomal protein S8
MSMTDPIADLLARIRNAQMARHPALEVPASAIKLAIVTILKEEGFIEDFTHAPAAVRATIGIQLRYDAGGRGAISGMERISRASRRVYRRRNAIPKVLDGLGITIVSTPAGVMTGTDCRRRGVGGEILCNVW